MNMAVMLTAVRHNRALMSKALGHAYMGVVSCVPGLAYDTSTELAFDNIIFDDDARMLALLAVNDDDALAECMIDLYCMS